MAGISFGWIRKAGAWAGGLSRRRRAVGGVLALAVIGGLAWLTVDAKAEARLVRSDPDAAAADPKLLKFALGRGDRVYAHNCVGCHGVGAHGDRIKGAPDLTDNDWLYGDGRASGIERVILHGIRAPNAKTWRLADMPAFARKPREPLLQPLSPGDIHDVVEFLSSMRSPPASPEAAVRGSKIFFGRGACYDCHGSDAHGDPAVGGPNLSDNIWLYGGAPKAVFDSIAYGRAGYCPAWQGRLSATKIREVALYVYALSHRRPSGTRRSVL